ncbi:MAG: hypothetical protein OI715_00080 (plasmid) [Candidatus Methanoperedens sp.]|nr:MAG: hypothetical protein OI715_00080 [Candidatus Methanoperedens sp.]
MEKSLSQMTVSTFAAAGRTFSNISYVQHPEDQILNIVREKRSVLLSDLPKHLRRPSKWTLNHGIIVGLIETIQTDDCAQAVLRGYLKGQYMDAVVHRDFNKEFQLKVIELESNNPKILDHWEATKKRRVIR